MSFSLLFIQKPTDSLKYFYQIVGQRIIILQKNPNLRDTLYTVCERRRQRNTTGVKVPPTRHLVSVETRIQVIKGDFFNRSGSRMTLLVTQLIKSVDQQVVASSEPCKSKEPYNFYWESYKTNGKSRADWQTQRRPKLSVKNQVSAADKFPQDEEWATCWEGCERKRGTT